MSNGELVVYAAVLASLYMFVTWRFRALATAFSHRMQKTASIVKSHSGISSEVKDDVDMALRVSRANSSSWVLAFIPIPALVVYLYRRVTNTRREPSILQQVPEHLRAEYNQMTDDAIKAAMLRSPLAGAIFIVQFALIVLTLILIFGATEGLNRFSSMLVHWMGDGSKATSRYARQ